MSLISLLRKTMLPGFHLNVVGIYLVNWSRLIDCTCHSCFMVHSSVCLKELFDEYRIIHNFALFLYSCLVVHRHFLHNITVYLRGGNKLWTLPLSSSHLRPSPWCHPWIRLVNVLRLGWSGPHAARWLLLHTGALSANPRFIRQCCRLTKTKARKRCCVIAAKAVIILKTWLQGWSYHLIWTWC